MMLRCGSEKCEMKLCIHFRHLSLFADVFAFLYTYLCVGLTD
jgi:hypothetical protein